ncbi:hypothetical protein SDC9_197578 [bioreactor metagenome]|uniref:Uncharacterized protein n=1 Tax=bioreactor metagenome TaxID=1076179 RepID=A0A645INN2_9ZZZZ
MFAKGVQAGGTPKADALALLPAGTTCKRVSAMGITGYVVRLADGKGIGAGGNPQKAWEDAHAWALRKKHRDSCE